MKYLIVHCSACEMSIDDDPTENISHEQKQNQQYTHTHTHTHVGVG